MHQTVEKTSGKLFFNKLELVHSLLKSVTSTCIGWSVYNILHISHLMRCHFRCILSHLVGWKWWNSSIKTRFNKKPTKMSQWVCTKCEDLFPRAWRWTNVKAGTRLLAYKFGQLHKRPRNHFKRLLNWWNLWLFGPKNWSWCDVPLSQSSSTTASLASSLASGGGFHTPLFQSPPPKWQM